MGIKATKIGELTFSGAAASSVLDIGDRAAGRSIGLSVDNIDGTLVTVQVGDSNDDFGNLKSGPAAAGSADNNITCGDAERIALGFLPFSKLRVVSDDGSESGGPVEVWAV